MKKGITTLLLLIAAGHVWAQATFKAGWNTYNTASLIHEYGYNFTFTDSIKLILTDSCQVYTTPDSLVIMTVSYPFRDKSVYKTVNYLSPKKLLLKTEEYKDDYLTLSKEWKYDDKGFKTWYLEDDRLKGHTYKKTYDHSTDKKTGETIVSETSYFNGRIEFYTKTYYDKKGVKLKEVRLNDNNKDVVHIETFYYDDNGRLKERSVFFPEWHVTKKFEEKEGNMPPQCAKCLPMGIADKVTLANRMAYMKKALLKNQAVIMDPGCEQFEYLLRNFSNCEITMRSTNVNKGRKVIFRYKEKP